MEANIRELKANLSSLLRRVQAGDTVTVRVRSRRVARIVPIAKSGGPVELARTPGVVWSGGKPKGLPRGEALPRGVSLSDWIAEDRRLI
jgi:prevent-host-death family protein